MTRRSARRAARGPFIGCATALVLASAACTALTSQQVRWQAASSCAALGGGCLQEGLCVQALNAAENATGAGGAGGESADVGTRDAM